MPCVITSGRGLGCKSFVGGISKVYFADFGTLGAITIVDNEITVFGGSSATAPFEWYEFDVIDNTALEETTTVDKLAGTKFTTQALTMGLIGQDKDTQAQLDLIGSGSPHVIIADNSGTYRLIGKIRGTTMTTSVATTGALLGDAVGYILTLTADEKNQADYVAFAAFSGEIEVTKIDPTP